MEDTTADSAADMSFDRKNRAKAGTTGMRVVFWVWMGIIVVGLTVMIVLPLAGR